jgi:hypothetical protein
MKMPAGVHKLERVPKGNNVKGKVWSDAQIILPTGDETTGRYETTRGAFVYFNVDGQHYRAFTERFKGDERLGEHVFDLSAKETANV